MENKQNKSECKRQRSENWTEGDKELLKELIKKRVRDVENKNTDTNTNHAKKKAWIDIEKDFNSLCTGKQRTTTQLRSQWTTIKMTAKKEVSEFRNKIRMTGGGQAPTEVPLSANDISVWLPNEFVTDSNQFDCDAIFSQTEENLSDKLIAIEDENVDPNSNITNDPCPTSSTNSESYKKEEYGKHSPQKTRKHSPQKRKISHHKNSASDESILKLAQTDIDCRKELHLLQIEAEKKRIRNLDLEYEILQAKLNFYKKKPFYDREL